MKPTHVIVRLEDGRLLESKGPDAAQALLDAMQPILDQQTFELRPAD
jgi:hypothetical protein